MAKIIGVVGAGTMGSGIALAAALKDYKVILCDINPEVIKAAQENITHNLGYLLNKNKITSSEKQSIFQSILFTNEISSVVADVVIEAVVEKTEIKEAIFKELAQVNPPTTILATNTSSLSVSAIQTNNPHPERVAGMHFFNPAHIMKLVELVKGDDTSDGTITYLKNICTSLGKVPVVCKDSPGFIVNRVARHFYLEALHLAENNITDIASIDKAIKAAGFKMGPFELMDLIGMDINYAVSESLYNAFEQAVRFKPSALQKEKVQNGDLGKKTGKGFYDYSGRHKN